MFLGFCVSGTPVTVNGWDRKEIRAFVVGRNDFSFRTRDVAADGKTPTLIELVPKGGTEGRINNCLKAESIEIDVPHGASVKVIGKSGSSSVVVDSIESTKVDIVSGDIAVSNVAKGVEAATDVGAIAVRSSGGKMILNTTAGNIVVAKSNPAGVGDALRAKTHSGSVTLQELGYKDVEAHSISGSLSFFGRTYAYGNYNFTTVSGILSLSLNPDFGFRLKAAFGGSFNSELALSDVDKSVAKSTIYLSGVCGSDNSATITISSFSGAVRLLRQPPTIDEQR
ncbi:MAG: DUF4097 family beta strand repeat-containing protein [Pyrinomonadaceae bacterium]